MTDTLHLVEYPTVKPKGKQLFTPLELSKEALVTRLLTHTRLPSKDLGSLFAPNTFDPAHTSRSKYGVSSVTFLVFDVERKRPRELQEEDVVALVERLNKYNNEYVLTSSYSHKEPDHCRFRLVFFINRPITPPEFKEVRARVATRFGLLDVTDLAAEDLSRIFYWPSCPADVEPVAIHRKGELVDVDDLLEGYTAIPHERLTRPVPEGWVYERPQDVSTYEVNLPAFHDLMDKYKGSGEEGQEKVRKTNLMQNMRKGAPLCSSNYNSTLWSAVNLLAFNMPGGTSVSELRTLLTPSMMMMYARDRGPISYEEAMDILDRMLERAVERRAVEDATNAALKSAIDQMFLVGEEAISLATSKPPSTAEELKAIEEKVAKIEFVYHVPEQQYYYRSGEQRRFTLETPVGREGIIHRLKHLGWDDDSIKKYVFAKNCTTVQGKGFAPNRPSIYSGNNETQLNSWVPPKLVPRAGSWSAIDRVLDSLTLNHVAREHGEVDTQHDAVAKAWLLNWLAWKVQNPAGVPGVAVLLNGAPQGTGKNTLAHVMFEILGQENCAKIGTRNLEGRFTSRWMGKAFIFGDEIFNRENFDVTDNLKDLITSQDVTSEAKGINEKVVRNHSAFLFASNSILPLRLERDDRRFSVFTRHTPVEDEYRAFTRSLFTVGNHSTPAFEVEIAAFAHHLLEYKVDEALARTPCDNASRLALIKVSKPSHLGFCEYVDEHGLAGLVESVVQKERGYVSVDIAPDYKKVFGVDWYEPERGWPTAVLHRCYMLYAQRTGFKPYSIEKFGGVLQQHRPAWTHKRPRVGEKRVWVWRPNARVADSDDEAGQDEGESVPQHILGPA